jgi:hypothetical protein
LQENAIFAMAIIEIRPFRNGWQVYEAPGVHPVFLSREQAIDFLPVGLLSDESVERLTAQ